MGRGSKSPDIRGPNVLRDFEENAVGLLSLPLPRITCAKAYAGREKVVAAFERYYATHGIDTASQFLKARNKTSERWGLSINDQARLDAVNGHAILANTTPTAFWTLYHIYCDPAILDEVRAQILPLLTVEEQDDKMLCTINISHIRDVPILSSILHESLRHYASGTGVRVAVKDTMLDDHYLLKKDSFIFMPNRSYHFDSASWGPTVNDFDAHRFMRPKPHVPGAFRGFGGGANVCPGRYFAMNDILAMCAMFALRYDMKPHGGVWVHPGTDDSNMSLIVLPPKHKTNVDIVTRQGWEGRSWRFRY